MTDSNKVVVIAMGNRFREDDGVGPLVARLLNGRLGECTVADGQDDAMALVNTWEGAELAVVIDAASTGASPGTIHRLEVDEKPISGDLARCSSHGLGLAEAVELGRTLGLLPARLMIFAVEGKTFEIGTALSPEVVKAAEEVAQNIESHVVLVTGLNKIDPRTNSRRAAT